MAKVKAQTIECVVDQSASAALGVASAFAAWVAMGPAFALLGAVAYWLSWSLLRRVTPVESTRIAEPLRDDLPSEPVNDPRVVQLFEPARATRNFAPPRPAAAPDASQALHDALSELRRSLR